MFINRVVTFCLRKTHHTRHVHIRNTSHLVRIEMSNHHPVHVHFRAANKFLFDARDVRQSGSVSALGSLPRTQPVFESVVDKGVMTCDVYTVHERSPGDEELAAEVRLVR